MIQGPQLLHRDVLAELHVAKKVAPRVLRNLRELIDDILRSMSNRMCQDEALRCIPRIIATIGA